MSSNYEAVKAHRERLAAARDTLEVINTYLRDYEKGFLTCENFATIIAEKVNEYNQFYQKSLKK